jgi:hypothetical protein
MFVLLFGDGVALMVNGMGAEFFRVMSSIVSIVSSAGLLAGKTIAGIALRPV